MVRTIGVVWTGIAAGLTAIVSIYMMTMPGGDIASCAVLLIGAVLCAAVCVGLAREGWYPRRSRALFPYKDQEPERRYHPRAARSVTSPGRPPARTDRKGKPRATVRAGDDRASVAFRS